MKMIHDTHTHIKYKVHVFISLHLWLSCDFVGARGLPKGRRAGVVIKIKADWVKRMLQSLNGTGVDVLVFPL